MHALTAYACFFSANVAAGNIEGVARDWAHVPPSQQGKGLEIVLQVHTLAGFPRTINALIKIQELGLHPEGTKYFDEVHDLAVWNKQGLETLDAVYGSVSEKMRRNFRKMHPLLESILTEHIYGRVLSRPLVDLRIRELCSLGIIAGQNLPLQLVTSSPHPRPHKPASMLSSTMQAIRIFPRDPCGDRRRRAGVASPRLGSLRRHPRGGALA
jgi:hypothetical protein